MVVVWEVSTGTPEEYAFKFGEAPVEDGQFCLTLGSPPKEMLNRGRLGISMLLLVDVLMEVPEGRLSEKAMQRLGAFGLSEDTAIVYVGPELGHAAGWVTRFPVGYSCARVTRDAPILDVLKPMSCGALSITAGDPEERYPPNWI